MNLILILCFFASFSFSADKRQKAHDHSKANLSLAVDESLLSIELQSPADSFLGFERKAKNKLERDALANLEIKWKSLLGTLIIIPKKQCHVKSSELKQVFEGDGHHSEIEAKAEISCTTPLEKSTLVELNFGKYFPRLRSLHVDIISSESKHYKIKKFPYVINL